jgi:hypothetical protein
MQDGLSNDDWRCSGPHFPFRHVGKGASALRLAREDEGVQRPCLWRRGLGTAAESPKMQKLSLTPLVASAYVGIPDALDIRRFTGIYFPCYIYRLPLRRGNG